LMRITKDWADSAIPAKSWTMGSKFGIKLPAQQSKRPSIQTSFCKTEGGFT